MALIKKIPINLIIFEIPFGYLAWEYFRRDSLQVYDAPSHLAAINYLKNSLWPAISGFNPQNLLGFDQGLLYPSLLHYSVASAGNFLGTELVLKLLIGLGLIALPVSFYFFVSTIFFNKNARTFATGVLVLIFLIAPGYLGADLKGLVQIGLLPSVVSLPLVFLYLWSVLKIKSSLGLSSLLLASVLLTHLVAGLFCLIFLVCWALSRFLEKNFKQKLVWHAIIAIGLSAFFLLPFVLNAQSLSRSVHLASFWLPNLTVLIVVGLLTISFWRAKEYRLIPVSSLAVFLALLIVFDAAILRFFEDSFFFEFMYDLHVYRYQIYLYFVTSVLIIYWPVKFLFEIPRRSLINPIFVSILPLIVVMYAVFMRSSFIVDQVQVNVVGNELSGRFLELFPREDVFPLVYSAQNKLMEETNKPWAYGLFTDGSPNGPYLSSLIRSFDPLKSSPEDKKFIERRAVDRSRNYQLLDLFAIENLLLLSPSQEATSEGINTLVMKSGVGSSLVEVPRLDIKGVSGDWDKKVEQWWFEKGKLKTLLVENSRDRKVASTSTQVRKLTHNKDWTKFSFEVDGQEEVPVLVKFTYLPAWEAWSNREKLEIHRASPYLMLVYASGKVDFEYRRLWYHPVGLAISVVSLVVLVVLSTKKKPRRNAKR